MAEIRNCDSLNFGDALFLHLERHGSPLHVAAIYIFDGEIEIDDFASHIESRLPRIPRYLQRVLLAPFGLGMPMWEFDPNFDIHNHVREIKLKRGTESELQKEVSHVLSHRLHRERPLWEFILFTGLHDNQCALLARVHHALADGISGVSMLNAIMDSEPITPNKPSKPLPKPNFTPRDPATHLMDSLVTSWFSMLERVLTVESQLLRMAQDALAKAANGANSNENFSQESLPADLTELLPEFGAPPERLPFNVVCRGPQSFEWTELPFDDIRAIKRVCNATVNDAMLTLIAMTVRKYALVKGASVDHRIIRIVVPVNVRTQDQADGLGNQITFVPVTVPVGIKDPQELLHAVHTRTAAVKKLRLAEMVGFAGVLLGQFQRPSRCLLRQLSVNCRCHC